jgi:hypothetical protein
MTVASPDCVFHSPGLGKRNAPRDEESGDPINQTSPDQPDEVSHQ